MKSFENSRIDNPAMIKGGGRISYCLGYVFGKLVDGMAAAGEGLESSGFNGAGANK